MSSGSEHSGERVAATSGSLHGNREATSRAAGSAVPKLTTDHFFERVLPPLHRLLEGKVDLIWKKLVEDSAYDTCTQQWTAFRDVEGQNENKTFAALVLVARAIEAAAAATVKPLPEQILEFSNDPDCVPESTWRTSTNKPDGYFTLCKRQRPDSLKAHWMDIGPTGEYKLKSRASDVSDNLEKLLWNLSQTVKDDARRRFTFAFTIEKTHLRLWYGGRAEYVASDTFDFMLEPKRLVHFFLRFFYAPAEYSGWDPTMQPLWEGPNHDQLQYIITVRSNDGTRVETYKTITLLSNVGAEALRGRGTRVWLAEPCDSAGKSLGKSQVVVKDCWIDQGLDREGEIMRSILQDAKKLVEDPKGKKKATGTGGTTITPSEYAYLQNALLTPEIDGDVQWADEHRAKIVDRTLDRAEVYPDGTPYYYIFDKTIDKGTVKRLSQLQEQLKGEHRSVWQQIGSRDEPVEYNSKVHYRIVFKEVCRAIQDERYLEDILLHLSNVCQALSVLHKVGWVHRDISAGNILLYRCGEDDVVKLADFEYAKNTTKTDGKQHDIRTGTLDFMAVEVFRGDYLFLKDTNASSSSQQEASAVTGEMRQRKKRAQPKYTTAPGVQEFPIGWVYNPIHDVESIWWLAAFFVLNKDVLLISKDDGETQVDGKAVWIITEDCEKPIKEENEELRAHRISKQSEAMRSLFYRGNDREWTFLAGLRSLRLTLHPALEALGVMGFLDEIRRLLKSHYETAEAAVSIESPRIGPAPILCAKVADCLERASNNIGSLNAHVVVCDLAREAALSRDVSRRKVIGEAARVTGGVTLMTSIAEDLPVQGQKSSQDEGRADGNRAANGSGSGTKVSARRKRTPRPVAPSDRRLRSRDNAATQPVQATALPPVTAPGTEADNTPLLTSQLEARSSQDEEPAAHASSSQTQLGTTVSSSSPTNDGQDPANPGNESVENRTARGRGGKGGRGSRGKGRGKGRGRGTGTGSRKTRAGNQAQKSS